jgi:transposase
MSEAATEELWAAMAPHVPAHKKSPKGGRPPVDDRLALEGILFVLREGCRWQSLPTEKGWGSGSTCWRRFAAWTRAGVWDKAHDRLLAALGAAGLLNLERAIVDSASSRAQKGGRTPGPTRSTAASAASSGTP